MDKFLKLSFINHLRNHDEIAGEFWHKVIQN